MYVGHLHYINLGLFCTLVMLDYDDMFRRDKMYKEYVDNIIEYI